MGRRIVACATESTAVTIVAKLDQGEIEPWMRGPMEADVVLDFSSDAGAQLAVAAAVAKRAALLIGTTALTPATLRAAAEAASTIPVMIAPNTSLGVAVARHLVREAARLLGQEYDIEIVERHHRHKVDAPSGTAKVLAEASALGGRAIAADRIHAQRLGDIIGEHTVTFAGPGEILEVRHAATSRDLFALGAIRLGGWLARQPAGTHTVDGWLATQLSGGGAAAPGGAP